MKKFMIVIFVAATFCMVSCTKEHVSPKSKTIDKTMRSGGGDKIPSGTYD